MQTKILKPLPLFRMGYDKIKNLILDGILIFRKNDRVFWSE